MVMASASEAIPLTHAGDGWVAVLPRHDMHNRGEGAQGRGAIQLRPYAMRGGATPLAGLATTLRVNDTQGHGNHIRLARLILIASPDKGGPIPANHLKNEVKINPLRRMLQPNNAVKYH